MILAFAPFLTFAVVDRHADSVLALTLAAFVAGGLLLRDWLAPDRTIKILDAGGFILFAALAAVVARSGAHLSPIAVRLVVDTGLLAIVLTSLAIKRPFTMQYAREQVGQEHWASPEFLRTNFVISGVWAAAFAVMAAVEGVLVFTPDAPRNIGVAVIVLALAGAFLFTKRYTADVPAR